jgi:two-component sensor histidine kinase
MPVKKKQAKAGLGTGIVEALAKQLDATVTVLDAKPGTRVEVRHRRA